MISLKYTYPLMGISFLLVWLSLFITTKKLRNRMVIISVLFGFAGVLSDFIYFDWWRPITLTGSLFSPEQFIVGFGIGGVASVLYPVLFNYKLVKSKVRKEVKTRYLLVILLALFYLNFFAWGINSFYNTIISLGVPVIIVYLQRKDLIIPSIISGTLMVVLGVIVYGILNILTPGWITQFWIFENVPHLIFIFLPVDDVVFYFLSGAFISMLIPYGEKSKFVKND